MKKILFYDGYCKLCNNLVKFVIKNCKEAIYFSHLDGKLAKKLHINQEEHVYLKIGKEYLKAQKAIFWILKNSKFPWNYISYLAIIPIFSKLSYIIISKTRYSIFGKYTKCPIPHKDQKKLFI